MTIMSSPGGGSGAVRRVAGLRRAFVFLLLLTACAAGAPRDTRAQAVPAAYGLVAGTAAGAYVSTGVFVARARAGSYLYSLGDALAPRWEIIPAVALPFGGLLIGLDDGQRLASSLVWGGAGFAGGALVGLGVSGLIAETDQGRWAGAIIGSAAGLLAGTIYGALSYDKDDGGAGSAGGSAAIVFRIPL